MEWAVGSFLLESYWTANLKFSSAEACFIACFRTKTGLPWRKDPGAFEASDWVLWTSADLQCFNDTPHQPCVRSTNHSTSLPPWGTTGNTLGALAGLRDFAPAYVGLPLRLPKHYVLVWTPRVRPFCFAAHYGGTPVEFTDPRGVLVPLFLAAISVIFW